MLAVTSTNSRHKLRIMDTECKDAPREDERIDPTEAAAALRNLEDGAAVRELRRELHESQQSMIRSDEALKSAAAKYFENGALA